MVAVFPDAVICATVYAWAIKEVDIKMCFEARVHVAIGLVIVTYSLYM